MKTTLLVKINPRDPDLARVREVARASREGKIVAFPTETVYGMGAPMSLEGVHQKLAQLKGRDEGKPFAFHIGEPEMVDYLEIRRTPVFRYFTRLFWPGPVTVLALNRKGEKVGVRFPMNRLAAVLIASSGQPFVATSANMSGQPSPRNAGEVLQQMEGRVEYILDGGPCEIGQDSTIVDLSEEARPEIVRAGAWHDRIAQAVEKVRQGRYPRKRILIVCTGNSCRSPMAEAWLRDQLQRKNIAEQIEVSSCGIGARAGAAATYEAIYVMKNREIDISRHRAQVCTRDDVVNADMIIAMSEQHALFITGMVPDSRAKIKVFNVIDPIGMSMQVYEDVIRLIEKKIKDLWNEIIA